MTGAATTLGMTQPAVSRHIRDLERTIGQQLFDRSPNRVSLNAAGEQLLVAVQGAFDGIEHTLAEFNRAGPTFLLAANPGFAQRWLVPHLDPLQQALGDADLRLRLFDRDHELHSDAFDAAIHLMPIAGAPHGTVTLFEERVVPVAAPSLATKLGLNETTHPAALLEVVKLHLDARDRCWMDWSRWFGAHDLSWSPASVRLSYNNYALVMNDTILGHGVALAWRGLVDALLESEALVQVGPEVHRPELAYQLIPGPAAPSESVQRVCDWVRDLVSA